MSSQVLSGLSNLILSEDLRKVLGFFQDVLVKINYQAQDTHLIGFTKYILTFKGGHESERPICNGL